MKNSPAKIVSNSQRVRANAVWLMNAASLAIAIGAVSQVMKSNTGSGVPSFVPEVKALDFYWTGTTGGSWGSSVPAAGTKTWTWGTTSGGAATTTYMGGTAGNSLAGAYATDKFYFGASGASGTNITQSGNQVTGGITFNSGASSYTFNGTNQRMITLGGGGSSANRGYASGSTQASGAWSAASTSSGSFSAGIYNNATGTTQTFNTAIRVEGNGNAGTGLNASTISAVTGATMVFAGTKAASYVINPYALEYYGYQAGATTQSGAQIAGSTAYLAAGGASTSGQAFALSSSNTGTLNIAGAGTIRITGSIDNGTRLNSATSVGVGSGGPGSLNITSTGTTYLAGWNTYTGTTTISGGTVVVQNRYAFGGNRTTDTTAPGSTGTGTAASGNYGQYNGFNAPGSASFGNVTLNAGGTIDLSGTTMVGANALTINGTGAAGASGALQNSNTTAATYAGAVVLASDSTINAGTGNLTLSGGLNTATNAATISGAQNTSVTGVLSGTGSINKTDAGTLTLSGNNTYTGSININEGVVSLAAASGSALGTGTAALSFGASNTPTLTLGGRSATMGNLSSSNINSVIQNDNATAATFTSSAPGTTTFAGKLSDGATGGKLSFVKAGSGTLTLSNTQDYTGTTTVAGGTLSLTGSTKVGSAVTVNSGATLSGSGTVNDSLTVSGSISPGAAGVGNLTAGATSLQSGGTLNVQIYDFSGAAGSTGWDLLTSTGAIAINSTSDLLANKFNITLSSITGLGVDTVGSAQNFTSSSNYTLKILTGTSISGFEAAKFYITNSLSNLNTGVWSIGQSGNDINLIYTASNAQFWNGASGWDGSATVGGAGTWESTGYSSSLDTFFSGTGAAVTVDAVTTSKAIKFQSDSYVLSNGTITLTGADSSTNKIDVGTGLTTTINSQIVSTTSELNKTGLGTLVLGGANGTSGISSGISIVNGTIKIASADALGSSASAVTVASGATLDLNGQSVTNTNSLTLSGTGVASAGGALVNTSGNAATYAGLLTLGAATTINASSGSISLTNAGTITGSGFALTVDGASDTSIASVIGTGTGGITKTGNGTLTLSGTNTYTGATTVSAGKLKLGSAGALGSSGATYSAATVASGATLDLNGQSVTNTNSLTLSGTGAASAGGALVNTSTNAASIAGQISLNGATTINAASGNITLASSSNFNGRTYALTVDGSYNTTINSGVNSGTNSSGTGGYITFIKKGTGTLTLNGNNGSSTDSSGNGITALTIDEGSVTLGHTQALGSNGANPFGLTWAGYGSSVIIKGGATLNANGLVYGKTPIVVLSGTGASGMGGAIVNTSTTAAKFQGVYLLAADATIASSNGGLDINANSTNVKFFNIRDKTLTLTGTGTSGSDIVSTAIIGTGDLRKTGTGTWALNPSNSGTVGVNNLYLDYNSSTQTYSTVAAPTVAQSNSFSGNVYVDAGTLKLLRDAAFGTTGGTTVASATVASGATLDLVGRTIAVATTLSLSGTGAASAGGALVNSSTSAAASYSGLVSLAGDATINSSAGNITLGNAGTITGNTFTLTVDGASNTTINSIIGTGTGGLIKNGAGTLTLNGVNTYTGDTIINAGSVVTDSRNIAGSIANSGTLQFNNTSAANYSGTITGSGIFTKSGAGTVNLSAVNTYSGATTISAGVLNIGSAGSIASSAVTVANAATLKATNSYTGASMPASALTGAITLNSGALVDLTEGSLKATSLTVAALSGSEVTKISYTIGNSFALTGALTLTGNLVLDLTGTLSSDGVYDVLTYDSKSGGTISLFDRSGGSGTWGNYSVTGNTTATKYTITVSSFTEGGNYSSGNISVPNGGSIGAFSGGTANISADNTVINTFSGGNLALTSNAKVKVKEGSSSGVISGTGALVKEGTGILELTAANTYTAKTEITEGTLKVSSKDANGKIDGLGTHTDLALGSGSNESKLSIAATGAATLDKNIIASSTDRTGTGNILENSGTGLLTVTGSLTKDGTVLTLAGGANGMKVTGNIIGASSGSDLVVSSGVVTVSSSNSYNGPTFVQNTGTLIADNASATGAGIVNVANGATLQVGTSTNYALTLSTGGFALTNGAIIRVYVGSVDVTGLTANAGAAGFDTNYTHFDLSNNAGVTYSTLTTSGTLDLTGVTAGGITIQVYSTDAVNGTTGLEKAPFYDFKFLQAASVTHSLGGAGNIASLFSIDTSNLKYSDGTTVDGAKYAGNTIAGLIKMYTVTSGGNTVLMMSIPEPSTYGLGLGALALAVVAIRRRKQKKSVA
ncbi:MAG: PEP-CTERM sorting domain-containing protein [Opitutales bacterium]|nr:PEP-CTERM sorting domain-containing protein [Opitutales bacterium]